jgi:hypothetical protein
MRHDRTSMRGVEVRLVDFTSLAEKATVWAREAIPDRVTETTVLRVGFAPWGVFTAADGQTVLVCVEGVGYLVTDDESTTASVSFYAHRKSGDGSKFVGMAPVASATVTLQELAALETGETVDLTDHVRSFGERLESNVREMHLLATNVDHAAKVLVASE